MFDYGEIITKLNILSTDELKILRSQAPVSIGEKMKKLFCRDHKGNKTLLGEPNWSSGYQLTFLIFM